MGLAIVESKRWGLSLDGRADRQAKTAPSTQMLRYLRRVDDLTTGRLRWGILTNGARWRLYYQGARSVSEEFCEIDLTTVLDLPGHNEGLFALDADDRRHWLTVFVLLFRRDAFLPTATDRRTFHRRALEEGRYYEQRVATDLSNLVFDRVFPELARAVAEAAPDAPLPDVRDATLTLLYRLLFILYAEDRELLPVRDERYDDYGLRMRVRDDIRTRKDRNDVFSATATRYWTAIDDLATAIDRGDASIGLPPYNGGLFDRERTPLLANIRLGDQLLADVIDTLSFEQSAGGRRYINYRDLSVQQLGSIYERLLERELVRDGETIVVRPNVFARKGSGSYFTPHDLVNLILEETIGSLVQARLDAFARAAEEFATRGLTKQDRIATLERLDPAERILRAAHLRPGDGLRTLSRGPRRLLGRPGDLAHGGIRGHGRRLRISAHETDRRCPPDDHRQCQGTPLDRRSRSARRPPPRAADRAEALRLWRGPQPDGRRASPARAPDVRGWTVMSRRSSEFVP